MGEGPTTQHPGMLRSGQVARLLSVGRETVRVWTVRGKLQAVKTRGGQYRYPPQPIYDLVAVLTYPEGSMLPNLHDLVARHRNHEFIARDEIGWLLELVGALDPIKVRHLHDTAKGLHGSATPGVGHYCVPQVPLQRLQQALADTQPGVDWITDAIGDGPGVGG